MRLLSGRILLVLTALAGSIPAMAEEPSGVDLLERFYAETEAFHADFRQEVTASSEGGDEVQTGQVWIQRPDRFRWAYQEPYEQLIVADGRTVKFYDPGMDQVTVRPYTAGMGLTPSRILAGGGELAEHFTIRDAGRSKGLFWVALEPRNRDNAAFRKARVGLSADPVRVRQFAFTDAFDKRTRLIFEDIRANPDIPADKFRFEPPQGTDVLGDWGQGSSEQR